MSVTKNIYTRTGSGYTSRNVAAPFVTYVPEGTVCSSEIETSDGSITAIKYNAEFDGDLFEYDSNNYWKTPLKRNTSKCCAKYYPIISYKFNVKDYGNHCLACNTNDINAKDYFMMDSMHDKADTFLYVKDIELTVVPGRKTGSGAGSFSYVSYFPSFSVYVNDNLFAKIDLGTIEGTNAPIKVIISFDRVRKSSVTTGIQESMTKRLYRPVGLPTDYAITWPSKCWEHACEIFNGGTGSINFPTIKDSSTATGNIVCDSPIMYKRRKLVSESNDGTVKYIISNKGDGFDMDSSTNWNSFGNYIVKTFDDGNEEIVAATACDGDSSFGDTAYASYWDANIYPHLHNDENGCIKIELDKKVPVFPFRGTSFRPNVDTWTDVENFNDVGEPMIILDKVVQKVTYNEYYEHFFISGVDDDAYPSPNIWKCPSNYYAGGYDSYGSNPFGQNREYIYALGDKVGDLYQGDGEYAGVIGAKYLANRLDKLDGTQEWTKYKWIRKIDKQIIEKDNDTDPGEGAPERIAIASRSVIYSSFKTWSVSGNLYAGRQNIQSSSNSNMLDKYAAVVYKPSMAEEMGKPDLDYSLSVFDGFVGFDVHSEDTMTDGVIGVPNIIDSGKHSILLPLNIRCTADQLDTQHLPNINEFYPLNSIYYPKQMTPDEAYNALFVDHYIRNIMQSSTNEYYAEYRNNKQQNKFNILGAFAVSANATDEEYLACFMKCVKYLGCSCPLTKPNKYDAFINSIGTNYDENMNYIDEGPHVYWDLDYILSLRHCKYRVPGGKIQLRDNINSGKIHDVYFSCDIRSDKLLSSLPQYSQHSWEDSDGSNKKNIIELEVYGVNASSGVKARENNWEKFDLNIDYGGAYDSSWESTPGWQKCINQSGGPYHPNGIPPLLSGKRKGVPYYQSLGGGNVYSYTKDVFIKCDIPENYTGSNYFDIIVFYYVCNSETYDGTFVQVCGTSLSTDLGYGIVQLGGKKCTSEYRSNNMNIVNLGDEITLRTDDLMDNSSTFVIDSHTSKVVIPPTYCINKLKEHFRAMDYMDRSFAGRELYEEYDFWLDYAHNPNDYNYHRHKLPEDYYNEQNRIFDSYDMTKDIEWITDDCDGMCLPKSFAIINDIDHRIFSGITFYDSETRNKLFTMDLQYE